MRFTLSDETRRSLEATTQKDYAALVSEPLRVNVSKKHAASTGLFKGIRRHVIGARGSILLTNNRVKTYAEVQKDLVNLR